MPETNENAHLTLDSETRAQLDAVAKRLLDSDLEIGHLIRATSPGKLRDRFVAYFLIGEGKKAVEERLDAAE